MSEVLSPKLSNILGRFLHTMRTRHNGRQYAIRAVEICERWNATSHTKINDIAVRDIVNHLRRNGVPICVSTEIGYWYSEDPKDVCATVADLKARISGMAAAITGLQKWLDDKANASQQALFEDAQK